MRKLFNKLIATLTLLSLVLSVFTPTIQAHAESGVDDYDEEDYYSEGCSEEEFRKGDISFYYNEDADPLLVGGVTDLHCYSNTADSKFSVTSSDESVLSVTCTGSEVYNEEQSGYYYYITALKGGKATITVTETYKDQTYTLLERTITVDDTIFLNNSGQVLDEAFSELSSKSDIKEADVIIHGTEPRYLYVENFYDFSGNARVGGDVEVSTNSELLKVSTYSEEGDGACAKVIKLTSTGKGYGAAEVSISYDGKTEKVKVYVVPHLIDFIDSPCYIRVCTKFKPDPKKFYLKSANGLKINTKEKAYVNKRGNMWETELRIDVKSKTKEGFYKIKVGYKGTKKTVYVDVYKKGKKKYKTSETIWLLPTTPEGLEYAEGSIYDSYMEQ